VTRNTLGIKVPSNLFLLVPYCMLLLRPAALLAPASYAVVLADSITTALLARASHVVTVVSSSFTLNKFYMCMRGLTSAFVFPSLVRPAALRHRYAECSIHYPVSLRRHALAA
jgi:hypothetical protein